MLITIFCSNYRNFKGKFDDFFCCNKWKLTDDIRPSIIWIDSKFAHYLIIFPISPGVFLLYFAHVSYPYIVIVIPVVIGAFCPPRTILRSFRSNQMVAFLPVKSVIPRLSILMFCDWDGDRNLHRFHHHRLTAGKNYC